MIEAIATATTGEVNTLGWTAVHYVAAATGLVLIVLGCVL